MAPYCTNPAPRAEEVYAPSMPNTSSPVPLAPELPKDIPDSFFREIDEKAVVHKLAHPVTGGVWQPQKAQYWYDSIIDWMFANPGGTIKQCAADLGRNPVTIGLIVRSDIFKSRYAARRARFSEELDHRLVGKLAKVAELGLDLTIEVMEKKRDSVPLPLLNDITKSAMDRLGYGPSPAQSASVVVHNNVSAQVANVPDTVSVGALEKARGYLALLQSGASGASEVIEVKAIASEVGGG